MKIQSQDFYCGVVLAQLAEYPVLTTINKTSKKRGLYRVNDDKSLLVKYSSAEEGEWKFTFVSDDMEAIFESGEARGCSHLLICVYILIFGRRSGCFGWY